MAKLKLPDRNNFTLFLTGIWAGTAYLIFNAVEQNLPKSQMRTIVGLSLIVIGILPVVLLRFKTDPEILPTVRERIRKVNSDFALELKQLLVWFVGAFTVAAPGSIIIEFIGNAT